MPRAWPDRRFLDLTGAMTPIVQAPMANSGGVALAIAAMRGGAVGSLPCAVLSADQVTAQVAEVRAAVSGPINLNFFCHRLDPAPDDATWRASLAPYYAKEGVEPGPPPPLRRPFDAAVAAAVEAARPEIVSFHFGLPASDLLDRVRHSGARVLGSATTPQEMRWLADAGVDAVIAQGSEAGGHSGWFLDRHRPTPLAELLRTKIDRPVIAAGGLVDAQGIAAALRAGASAVQLGTLFLAAPESLASALHRTLLGTGTPTVFTNLFTGREARGFRNRLINEIGPMNQSAPPFPHASAALAPLRAKAEREGRDDYSPFWAGTGAERVRAEPAEALARRLAGEVINLLEAA